MNFKGLDLKVRKNKKPDYWMATTSSKDFEISFLTTDNYFKSNLLHVNLLSQSAEMTEN